MVDQLELQGRWHEVKGKLRERWGQLSEEELQGSDGNVEQLIGLIQRKTGETREQIENYLDNMTRQTTGAAEQAAATAQQYGRQAAERFQASTEQARQAMQRRYTEAERVVRERPAESMAIAFGTGLIAGAVIGLAMRSR